MFSLDQPNEILKHTYIVELGSPIILSIRTKNANKGQIFNKIINKNIFETIATPLTFSRDRLKVN
jgi:hypothetical protein